MRALLHSTVATVALGAVLTLATIPASAQGVPSQQQAAPAPEKGDNPPATAAQDNRKTSGTNDQSGPSSAQPTPDQHRQGDQATHSVSGRGGKEEPGSHAPTQNAAVLVDGKLNVPGAPADSQTVPAKFSERNDRIDRLPIMAMPLGLSDAQRKKIVDGIKAANKPMQATRAKPSEELPWNVMVHDLPDGAGDAALPEVKYVRTADRILLVQPSNRIVIEEIAN